MDPVIVIYLECCTVTNSKWTATVITLIFRSNKKFQIKIDGKLYL
jgi:hypothetical protein